ncbi:hypothetical protein [Helicobacter sp. 11S02629-2]|uniref:hypothetical protein n=1 Tax=Helicobacter sp. 11S02629-2 TaxID=1476195 RepID=UPI000BA623BE|nr:hypothetical protein [Helicobacter sp. 11S02629-2]PAF42750.1 hypothetical protein BKH40_07600 [Helicobacter sp. 11S02629-2]
MDENNPELKKDPDDTSIEEYQLGELQKELEETTGALDSNFIEDFSNSLSEDESALAYQDLKKFLALYEEKKKAYIEEKLLPLQQKGEELSHSINTKKTNKQIRSDEEAFLIEHPDANLDVLQAFMDNDMTKAEEKALREAKSVKEGLGLVYNFWKQRGQVPKEKDLPKKLDASHAVDEEDSLALDVSLPANRR